MGQIGEIEKLKKYIEWATFHNELTDICSISVGELREIGTAAQTDMFHALYLLFEYGKAKDYQAVKAGGCKS